jgi:hypothetical protein
MLKNDPEARAYLIHYGGRRTPSSNMARVRGQRAKKHLVKLGYQHVWVSENGWALDASDLSGFMSSAPHVWKESPETIGEVGKSGFISSLLNAKVAAA